MNQSAVEFDEAELQRCQPVEMVSVYRSEKFSDRRLALLGSEAFSLAFAAVTALRQKLLFPPAIDAVGLKISALWLPQPLEQCIALAL